VAILLDEFHVGPSNTDLVRETLTRFVDRDLGPRDMVVVLKPLDSLASIRLTRDRDQIHHAIDSFAGRRGDYQPRTEFEKQLIAGTPARIEEVRAQVAISALNALVLHVGKLNDARKSVVLVSEGLRTTMRRRVGAALPTLDAVLRAANRYNVSIYPIDLAGEIGADDQPVDGAGTTDVGALRTLADGTDGRAQMGNANLDEGLQQIVKDSSAYYLVTYRSTHADDGKFREVAVRVNKPGVQLRVRKGYWALWPDEAFVADLLAHPNAPSRPALPPGFDVPRHVSSLIHPWFGVSRGDKGKVRVTFVWEPAPHAAADRLYSPPARVELKALGADLVQVFSGTVLPASGSGFERRADPATARAVFDVPPGSLRLVMSIQDVGSRQIDTDSRQMTIRDLNSPIALGTAEIVRLRTERDFRVVDADPDAVPTAAREFSRTERLIVRFPAYAPDGAPHVTARLLSVGGQPLRELQVKPPAGNEKLFQIDLPLAGFAPGEYSLEITVAGPGGDARDVVGFRVTS
jgi:VWFA-related protein